MHPAQQLMLDVCITTKYTVRLYVGYLDAGSKEVAEISLVLSESNLSPTASVEDVNYCLR